MKTVTFLARKGLMQPLEANLNLILKRDWLSFDSIERLPVVDKDSILYQINCRQKPQ